MPQADPPPRGGGRFSNGRLALICMGLFAAMVGMAFAAVPFYRAFCQATGFDGTPRRAEAASSKVLAQTVIVHFDTNVRGLPWKFVPVQTQQTIHIGATNLAYFTVENDGKTPITGRALYSVAPAAAAEYFLKLQCFCFSDQTMAPGVKKTFPVVYYVDPKFASDPDTNVLSELTLSYTFYPATDVKSGASSGPQNKG
jgi:cytochrome c oxidase assembly protein subunit 11